MLSSAWPGTKSFVMWAVSIPVTSIGMEQWIHGATTLIGFVTSLLGLGIALLGILYWLRKLRRQAEGKEGA